MYLGRIISKRKIQDLPEFIEVSDKFVEDDVPTLVVGKKLAMDIFGSENLRMLDKRVRKNVFWTFSKLERRADFEDDLKAFLDHTVKEADRQLNYYFVNIFTESLTFIKKFIHYVRSAKEKSVYNNGVHLFFYSGKQVIGLSLDDCEYIGIPREKILRKIEGNRYNHVFTTTRFLTPATAPYIRNNDKLVPYIHFMLP